MWENPVLIKEMRARRKFLKRGAATWVPFGLLGIIIVWAYYSGIASIWQSGNPKDAEEAFRIVLGLQVFLVWIIGSSCATNAITQEREQQTWQMLMLTQLRPSEIVLGKLLSRLPWLAVVMLVFVPFQVFCVFYSGMSVFFAVGSLFIVTIWGLTASIVSLYMSFLSKRTATATALTFLGLFIVTVGSGLICLVLAPFGLWDSPLLWVNPIRWGGGLVTSNPKSEDIASVGVGLLLSLLAMAGMLFHMTQRIDRRLESGK